MIVYGLTGVTLLIVILVMWRIAVTVLRRFDGSYEPAHTTPRRWARFAAGAARAARRASWAARRLPGAECTGCPDHATIPASLRDHYGTIGGLQTSPAPFPYAAAPLREPAPGDRSGGGHPPLVPPPLHHDAFRWPQRWHEPVERVSLPPVTGPAIAALAILTAPVAAHLAAIEQAKAEEWDAYVRETRPWDDDTGSFIAICADVMDGAS